MLSPTTFSDLPRELRDRIYEYAAVQNYPVGLLRSLGRQRPNGARHYMVTPNQPALALVSRQIRDEVLEVFLSFNIFEVRASMMSSLKTLASVVNEWRSSMSGQLRHLRHLRHRLIRDVEDHPRYPLWSARSIAASDHSFRLVEGNIVNKNPGELRRR